LGAWTRAPAESTPSLTESMPGSRSRPPEDVGVRTPPNDGLPAMERAEGVSGRRSSPECSERHQVLPADGPAFIRHEAVARESVAQIAHRYDVPPWQLREWNELSPDVERPRRGSKLRVRPRRVAPPRERIEVVVQPSDTWWRIAVAHGVDPMDLRSYNWPYRGKMTPGETLQIWIDPIIYDWIRATPGGRAIPESGVRRGAVGVGPPNDGMLVNGVKIPEGRGYRLRFPKSAYGTTHAVEQFLTAMESFTESEGRTPMISVGAMSRPRGGPLGQHQSHQTGRDLDVRFPRRSDAPGWGALEPRRIDWEVTWRLVQAFAETDVEVIFIDYQMQRRIHAAARSVDASPELLEALLQYPRGSQARRGLVRHADGHDKHMHVRFRCGPCEVECVQNGSAPS
jgi:murein endopeptidase